MMNRLFVVCGRMMTRHQSQLSTRSVTPIVITELQRKLNEIYGLKSFDANPEDIRGPNSTVKQATLPPRTLRDSYQEVLIPIGHDLHLRERYINSMKGLRYGRIWEVLDYCAVYCCHTHIQIPDYSGAAIPIVTVLVDCIDKHDTSISPQKDVKICGQVTWVGKTSLEVTMIVEQESTKDITARFLMAARDPTANRSVEVNPLAPCGSLEEELFKLGEKNRILRQEKAKRSLLKEPPNEEERNIIHNLFLKRSQTNYGTFPVDNKPEDSVWMEDTNLKTIVICHPEQRNMYNKVFGGFLMNSAYELAWANASSFCKTRPSLLRIHDIAFLNPVEIGDFLHFSSNIVYTEGKNMMVKVFIQTVDPLRGTLKYTDECYFLFSSNTMDIPVVIPRTYAESILYLIGMRHFKNKSDY